MIKDFVSKKERVEFHDNRTDKIIKRDFNLFLVFLMIFISYLFFILNSLGA